MYIVSNACHSMMFGLCSVKIKSRQLFAGPTLLLHWWIDMDGAKSLRNTRLALNQIEWISCGNKFSTFHMRSYIQTEMTIQLLFQNKINAIFITGNRKKMEHMTNVM